MHTIAGIRRRWRAASAALGAMLIAGSVPIFPALALDVQPLDYTALPAGTDMYLQYFAYSHDDGMNVIGGGNASARLDSEVGLSRYVHFGKLFGLTVSPQFVIPYGSINDVSVGDHALNSSTGIGDPVVAMTIWPVEHASTSTYVGITPLLTLPIGKYRDADSVNLCGNRFVGDMQIGAQTALGATGWRKRLIVSLYGDGIFYSDNDRAGGGRLTLKKEPTWQVQSWISYEISDTTTVSIGYSGTGGGVEHVDGLRDGSMSSENQIRLEAQRFITRHAQLGLQFSKDLQVEGGFKQDVGVTLRALLLF